jgi:hypothetical protein
MRTAHHSHFIIPAEMQPKDETHAQCTSHGQVFISKHGTLTDDDVDQLLLSPSTQPRWNVASRLYTDKPSNQLLRRTSIRNSKVCSKPVASVKHTTRKKVQPLPRVDQAGRGTSDKDKHQKSVITFTISAKDAAP